MPRPKRQGPDSDESGHKSGGGEPPRLPLLINPNKSWPFLLSIRDGYALINMAPRETQAQRLAQLEEAKW